MLSFLECADLSALWSVVTCRNLRMVNSMQQRGAKSPRNADRSAHSKNLTRVFSLLRHSYAILCAFAERSIAWAQRPGQLSDPNRDTGSTETGNARRRT